MDHNNILGTVLAGGKSQRFGEDKSQVTLANKLLIDYVLSEIIDQFKEILIVSVMSRTGGRWNGEDLFRLLQEKGLKFGDMNIFHRPEVNSRNILFSVANSLEPGTFDLSRLDQMYTPGVSIFMQLPGPQDPLAAFDEMIEVAHSIAAGMNGELRDESRNLMTSQTISYYRQRIEEFTRRRLRVKAS